MISACAAPQSAGFIGSVVQFIDCRAELFGTGAYQALLMPGSALSIVLTGFLTIFIALIGYNLLLGHGPTVRTGTIAFIKIGAVLALATSWPAYQTLVYNLATDAPGQLVREIARPSTLPGSDGTLVQRLDLADGALVQLAILGSGPVAPAQVTNVAPPPFGGFDAFALGGSRILFLIAAIAGLATVRITAALMLALGPFFIAFLLFDSTRSLFEGWVRVLAGAALASIGVTVALGFELALLEPWLSGVLARRMAGEGLPSIAVELFVLTVVFAIIVAVVIIGAARVARAFRLALPIQAVLTSVASQRALPREQGAGLRRAAAAEQRSRAAVMADVLATMQHREVGRSSATGYAHRIPAVHESAAGMHRDSDGRQPAAARLVPAASRRSRTRRSASSDRRDRN